MTSTLRITLVLAALVAPRVASAQFDPLTNVGACVVTGFAAGATSITVNTGCGATLPGTDFNASVCNTTDYPISCRNATGDRDPNYEVIRVSDGFGTDSLTIARAEEGTSDAAHNTAGKTYWLSTFTAKTITDITGIVSNLVDAPFVTIGNHASTTGDRALTGSSTITVTDNGANESVALAVDPDLVVDTLTVTGPVGSSALTLTGATQTASFPAINASQIWNAAGVVFTGQKFNVTNTASANGSLFADFQVGAASKLALVAKGWNTTGHAFLAQSTNSNGAALGNDGVHLGANSVLAFGNIGVGSTGHAVTVFDLVVQRDAADVLAQYRSTNAQISRLYNTRTDASNYERLGFTWATNVARIGTANAGTGTARVLALDYGGTTTPAISIPITSGDITLGGSVFPTGYKSADGTAGLTQTCVTTVTAITIKNGLVTAVTCP